MMKLFDKPKWLKPEINEPKYFVHLAILVFCLLIFLKYIVGFDILNWEMAFYVSIGLLLGDIKAHTFLKLD